MSPSVWTTSELVAVAAYGAGLASRFVLGIAGPPGVGKSTLAAELVGALHPDAALLPLDGFHIPRSRLSVAHRGRRGAPETFDVRAYLDVLGRVRSAVGTTMTVPGFDRDIEDPVPGAVVIPGDARIIVTEGNYLLLDRPDWREVRSLLDVAWFLDEPDDRSRRRRLAARHERYGKSPEEARAWTEGSDQSNADLIRGARMTADLEIAWAGPHP